MLSVGGHAGVSFPHLYRHEVMQFFRGTSSLYTVFVFNTECFTVVQARIVSFVKELEKIVLV